MARRGAAPPARVFAVAALLATTGCVRWTHLAPAELQIHGKAGQVCSAAATPLVWAVNTVFFPVSVASLGRQSPSHDNLGYPGLAVENGAYFVCATLGLPLYALGRGTERVFFLLADRVATEDRLIERLPYLSPEDYTLLVRTAQRTCPPLYDCRAGTGTPRPRASSGSGAPGWHRGTGASPRLANPLAAAEWRDWRAAAGRGKRRPNRVRREPRPASAEPAVVFASTYGSAQLPRFERQLAALQGRVVALEREGTPPAVAAALRDPSPPLRAAAARLYARSRGTAGAQANSPGSWRTRPSWFARRRPTASRRSRIPRALLRSAAR